MTTKDRRLHKIGQSALAGFDGDTYVLVDDTGRVLTGGHISALRRMWGMAPPYTPEVVIQPEPWPRPDTRNRRQRRGR